MSRLLQLYSVNKRLGGCCVYAVASHSSRGRLHDDVFAVTPETGIVYVSRPEVVNELVDDDVIVSLYVVVNGSDDRQSVSSPPAWLSVANISVSVQRVETDYNNVTSSDKRNRHYFSRRSQTAWYGWCWLFDMKMSTCG